MFKSTLIAMTLVASPALAQDQRDEDIFGAAGASGASAGAAAAAPAGASQLLDTMQIGGRLEIRATSAQEEQQKFPESSYSQLKRADIYFDTRPNKDLRSFLRIRLSETTPANAAVAAVTSGTTECQRCAKVEIDELWFKWDAADTVFFTLGKQRLKWGSGRLWNPTDFTALETRDPYALFDGRLGQELLKIHVPIEKQGFNYYAVLQFDQADRNDNIGAALRGEFAFGGIGEAAFSFQTRQDSPIRYGVDVSSGLGLIDVYSEAAITQRQAREFYSGDVDPEQGILPTVKDREDETFTQIVGGVQYSLRYNDDDSINVGAEYFDNGLGYDDRELELYSLFKRQSSSLYAGRRYAGGFVRVPMPGTWNETSFFLNAMRNLSDETTNARFTVTWELFKEATLEAFVGQCFGDYGELCFRMPEKFLALAASPALAPEERVALAALPTKRTKTTAGLAMSMKF